MDEKFLSYGNKNYQKMRKIVPNFCKVQIRSIHDKSKNFMEIFKNFP